MAKDKPRKKINMKDLQPREGGGVPVKRDQNEYQVDTDIFNEDLNEKLIAYNKKVTELDEKYTSLRFRNDILVRVFVRPMIKNEDGLYTPNRAPVKVSTNTGLGKLLSIDNPYPYESKAVVVSVPTNISGVDDLKPGMIVGLTKSPVQAVPIGRGESAYIDIPNAFVHPDERIKYVEGIIGSPEDPEDPNYGYLIVQNYEIQLEL